MNGKTYDLPLTTKELAFLEKAVTSFIETGQIKDTASENGRIVCEELPKKITALLFYAYSTEKAEKHYQEFKKLTEGSKDNG